VSRTNNLKPDAQLPRNADDARLEELTAQLRAALDGLDRGRALYIVISALVGDHLDRELAVVDPDAGLVLAYLVPPGERHALHAAARHPQRAAVSGEPAPTLDDVLHRVSQSADGVTATVGE
jgi:hypothetical protein